MKINITKTQTFDDYKLLNFSEYIKLSRRIKINTSKEINICLISTYTINGLAQIIKTMCLQNNIKANIFEIPYKQYQQYIINKSSKLYKFKADIIYWLCDPKSILKDYLNFYAEDNEKKILSATTKTYFNLIDQLVKLSTGTLILSLLPVPSVQLLGNFAINYKTSEYNLIKRINEMVINKYQTDSKILLFDINQFICQFGWENIHNRKLSLLGDYFISPEYFPHLSYSLLSYIKTLTGKIRKCIVLDLDNVLWGGIIGEDGTDGIHLGKEPPGNAYFYFQQTLLNFYKRGVILAINSNNNYQDAMDAINKHPDMILKKEYFASIQINWNDKVNNIQQIAKQLNIGLQSIIFIDDDPKKRLMVRALLPEVLTPELPQDPTQYSNFLLSLNDLNQINITKEDLDRGKKYFQQFQRIESQNTYTDLKTYLDSLKLKIIIRKADTFSKPRVFQLLQRTNQFNMTTKRYTLNELEKMIKKRNMKVLIVEVKDKFGDYGICGVLILNFNKSSVYIDTFLLSCRVLGLEIEHGILYELNKIFIKKRINAIESQFIATAKNKPAENFYKNSGFKLISKINNISNWRFDLLRNSFKRPEHLFIQYEN